MFNSIKQWWNRHDIRIASLEQNLNGLKELSARMDVLLAEKDTELVKATEQLTFLRKESIKAEEQKNSGEPWVDVHSAEFNTERGVQIELDWNAAFISYLKENGFKGKTEQIIVQKWLVLLYGDMITRLEEDSLEDPDQPSTFE